MNTSLSWIANKLILCYSLAKFHLTPIWKKVYETPERSITSGFAFYMASNVCTRICECRPASPYTNAVRIGQLLQNGRRARGRNIPGSIRISLSWHQCGGAFTVGRRRPSQPHRANCNSVETIGASGSSARRRMRDTIVRVWLVPGTFSSLTFLWWYNPPPRW